jgi:hypothetical protein
MHKSSLSLALASASLALLLQATTAQAQASRTWVSGVGDDANPCSRTAPCKTFAGAISKTAVNGEINCLDPGGFGALTITKSLTIDCHEVYGSILYSGTNGLNIAFDSFAPADAARVVRLRNINFNGIGTGLTGIRISGGAGGGSVFIEDCLIDGNFGGAARGISEERTGGGKLFVSNTTVRNNGQIGILVAPAGGGASGQRIDAVLDNVRIENSGIGIAVGNNTQTIIHRSVLSGHNQIGLFAGAAGQPLQVTLSNSVVSSNGTGIQNGGGATIRLSDSDISFNGTAIAGATLSFGNNRIEGNTQPGTGPTSVGVR